MRWWSLAMAACSGPDPAPDPTPGSTLPVPVPGLGLVRASLDVAYPTLVRVAWDQEGPLTVHLEYSFDEGVWLRSPDRPLGVGTHEELLLGVPYATEVTWRVVGRTDDGTEVASPDLVARTADPPPLLPQPEVWVLDRAAVDEATTHVLVAVNEGEANSTGTWTMLMDREGRVSWAHRSPFERNTMHPRITWDGDGFLIDHSSFFSAFDGGAASEILELKIDGTEVRRWATPGQHHPFTDLPDGSLAYAAYIGADEGRAENDVVRIVDPAGTVRELFGCAPFLAGLGEEGWCGSNTLSYDPRLDVFLFSLFTHDSVVEFDAATGTPNRWYGRIAGSWAFDPPSSMFDYQHGTVYLPSGHLLVSTHSELENTELAVREYALDAQRETLVEVWNAGVGLGVVGRQKGEAHRLPGGNTLQNFGTHAVIREFTPAGDAVWDVRWEEQQYDGKRRHQLGRSAPVGGSLYAFLGERP